jgi:hemoglobin
MRPASFRWLIVAASVVSLLGLAACTSGEAPAPAPQVPPLYVRLGGQPVLVAVVDDFVSMLKSDRRVNRRFRNANQVHLKASMTDQLCAVTGGPCHYTGKPMNEAHKGMRISDAEFNAVVQDLRRSLTLHNVAIELQTEVVDLLEPMRDDVVPPPQGRRL